MSSDSAHDNLVGWTFHRSVFSDPFPSASDATLAMGDLTLAPHIVDPKSCPLLFRSGEIVDMSGDRYAPAATIVVMLSASRAGSYTRTVHADDNGTFAVTVTLPPNMKGLPLAGSTIGYLEATGDGRTSTTQADNNMFGIGTGDASCGATPSITVSLSKETRSIQDSFAGAVFAVTGPGLPALTDSPMAGTFAELDTDEEGLPICPHREPTGVTCKDGDLTPVEPDTTYTVTEISAPPNLGIAQPQTITTSQGIDGPDLAEFILN